MYLTPEERRVQELEEKVKELEQSHKADLKEQNNKLNKRCEQIVQEMKEQIGKAEVESYDEGYKDCFEVNEAKHEKDVRKVIEMAFSVGWNNSEHAMWKHDSAESSPKKLKEEIFKRFKREEKKESTEEMHKQIDADMDSEDRKTGKVGNEDGRIVS